MTIAEGGSPRTVDGNLIGSCGSWIQAFDLASDLPRMARAGIRYLELPATGKPDFASTSTEELDVLASNLQRTLQGAGMGALSIAEFTSPFSDVASLAVVKRRIDLAKRLDLSVIVCDAGEVHDADQRRQALHRLVQAGDYAAEHGLTLALEIHPNIVGSGRAARELMRELNHPQVRVNYDTSNILYFSDLDPVEDLQSVVEFVAAVHLKDKSTRLQRVWDFVPLGQGVVDFPGVIEVLRQAHFKGPYSIELELAEIPDEAAAKVAGEEGLRVSLAYLREIGLLSK